MTEVDNTKRDVFDSSKRLPDVGSIIIFEHHVTGHWVGVLRDGRILPPLSESSTSYFQPGSSVTVNERYQGYIRFLSGSYLYECNGDYKYSISLD